MGAKGYRALLVLVVLLAGCGYDGGNAQVSMEDFAHDPVDESAEQDIGELADGTRYIVHPDKILSGGPPQDGIPSIDQPRFTTVEEADEWIADDELVLAIRYKEEKRVYPLQILVWHEIVNDVIAGDPVLITYCPLCGSGIAYHGQLAGERV